MSSIVWTTLPTQYDPATGLASVSVLVSPRIDDAPTVGQSLFTSWPTTVAGASFQVVLENANQAFTGAPIAATLVSSGLDASLWGALFPANTPIKAYHFEDNSKRALWSYSVDKLNAAIEGLYAYVAQSSANAFPAIDFSQSNPLTAWIGLMQGVNSQRIAMRDQLYDNVDASGLPHPRLPWDQQTRIEKAGIATLPDAPSQAAWQMKRFYDRPSNLKDGHGNLVLMGTDSQGNAAPVPIPRPARVSFDFHERVALLGDHPLLLERLGLVVKLQFPMSRDMTAPLFIRVIPSWGGPSSYDVTPRTAYERSGKRFAPRPQDPTGDHQNGMLALEDATRFGVFQVDVDGDGHKTINYASNIYNYAANFLQSEAARSNTAYVPPKESLPARRNGGFSITRHDRATQLQARFTTNLAIHQSFVPFTPTQGSPPSTPPNDLFMDDVARGYRVDVSMNGGPWQSLHQRSTHYRLGVLPATQTEILPLTLDEGYVKAASATSDPDPNGPKDMYVHEAIVAWHGWSLAAVRPGQTLFSGDDPHGNDTPGSQNLGATNDFPVDAGIRVKPGSLPSLRFGHSYQFRARVVDLTGHSNDLSDPTTTHATSAQTYQRYEPLPPPTIVLQSVVTEGESVEHMVIRSDPSSGYTDPTTYAGLLNTKWNGDATTNVSLSGAAQYKLYAGTSDRHVAPPKCSQIMGEQHGMFDAVFASADPVMWNKYFCLGTREEGTFMDWRLPSLNDPTVYDTSNPNGAVLITPPQVPCDQRRPANPTLTSSSLVANRGDALAPGEYLICTAGQLTTPYLPDPGAVGTVIWDPATNADLFQLHWGLWNSGLWPDLKPYRLEIINGASIGPAAGSNPDLHQITLPPATIYTVRMASLPDPAQLAKGVFAYANLYAPQADVLDGRHWMLTPYKEIKLVHAVPKPLAAPSMTLVPRREVNDTIVRFPVTTVTTHANSTGEVELIGEWDEYNDSPTIPAWTTQHQKGHAFRVEIPYGADTLPIAPQIHELGDTKHRVITYSTLGTTRYKEYFPARLIADPGNITVTGSTTGGDAAPSVFKVLIPSTVRPKPPKVEYVLPTFQFVPAQPTLTSKLSQRKGGGLRVYMDRPWFSSGQDEIVAVLLQPQGIGVSPATLPFVSRWGRDPIWDSKGNVPLDPTRFLNAAGPPVSLYLPEAGGNLVAVPFTPEYNAERQLWYIDIVMDPSDTYFPFVSLALARYQPYSLGGQELSPMVRADFAQLVPDRTLSYVPSFARGGGIVVTVTGAIADNALGEAIAQSAPGPKPPLGRLRAPRCNTFRASVQQRQVASDGDLGWVTIASTVTDLTGSLPLNSQIGTWTATVPLPLATGQQRRLVVQELETLQNDTSFFGATDRLVYMDVIALP